MPPSSPRMALKAMNRIRSLRQRIRSPQSAAARVLFALFLTVFLTGMDGELVRRGWLLVPGVVVFASCMASLTVWLTVCPGRSRAELWRQAALLLHRYRTFLSAFLALGVLSLIYWFARTEATPRDILTIPAAFCMCVAGAMLPMFPHVRRWRQTHFWFALTVYCLAIWIDVWRPGTFSYQETRAAGLAMNANTGAYMVSVLAVPLLFHRFLSRASLSALFLAGLSILPTLSRGGLLVYLALYCSYFLLAVVRFPDRRLLICIVTAVKAVLLIGIAWGSAQSLDFFSTEEAQQRVDLLIGQRSWLHKRLDIREKYRIKKLSESNNSLRWNPEKQAEPTPSRTDGQYAYIEQLRFLQLKNALAAIADSPIWGHGTRFSERKDTWPHIQYFALWIDFGLPGFLLYIALLTSGFRSFYKLRFLPGMFLIGVMAFWSMFSQAIFDARSLFMMLGLLLTLSLENDGNDGKQTTTPSWLRRRRERTALSESI